MAQKSLFDPLPIEQWPEEIADLAEGFAGRHNVNLTMAHHPSLLRGWAGLREHIINNNALGRERAEIVVLRLAHRLRADYEWSHHVLRGRAQGLDDQRIRKIRGPVREMAPADALYAGAVDELMDNAELCDATREALFKAVGVEGVLDLIASVGFFSTLAHMVKSFGTPLDENVARGLADEPL
jgi:alkylhydroperoxidase family enzyme